MAFYTIFTRPIGTSLCCNQYVVQIKQNEHGLLKFANLKKREFMSSGVKRKSGLQIQNAKGSKRLFPEKEPNVSSDSWSSVQLLVKPFLFTAAFTSVSLAGAAIWQYENVRRKAINLLKRSWLMEKINSFKGKKYGWRREMNKMWNQLTEGQKLFSAICFVNVVIFLAWKVPRFQPTMIKYFCCTPFSETTCWPMLFSSFSHYNALHLVANMYILHSFSSWGVSILGKEQFLGIYLAGGVISFFFSYAYKVLMRNQTLSTGASGAIMVILAYMCAKSPDSSLSVVFLPWLVFSAGTGIKLIMAVDLLGLIFRWRFLDHAAHLGGALTGLAWHYWGNAYIWQKREPLLQWWHELRSLSK